jgi:hypothetical protein
MSNDMKPVACTNIQAGASSVEINSSATGISAKLLKPTFRVLVKKLTGVI